MNLIGVVADGNTARGNTAGGVLFNGGTENSIGGTVISGNGGPGIRITGAEARGTWVTGTHVGFGFVSDATYTANYAIAGNGGPGILIDGGASGTRLQANDIGANGGGGVVISDAGTEGNVLEANNIGTDHSGTDDVGNGPTGVGVLIRASNNVVGIDRTISTLPPNVIAFNAGVGVVIQGAGTGGTPSAGNEIRGNSIHSNGGLGSTCATTGSHLTMTATPMAGLTTSRTTRCSRAPGRH